MEGAFDFLSVLGFINMRITFYTELLGMILLLPLEGYFEELLHFIRLFLFYRSLVLHNLVYLCTINSKINGTPKVFTCPF